MEEYRDYYVYELVDSGNNQVFYVGKGRGERAFHHEEEALSSNKNNAKLDRIRAIEKNGDTLKIRVIGRYEKEYEAFAVESTLIHWVYGYDNLTNIQSGHGSDTIRDKGNNADIEGIDIFTAGTYSQKREAEKNKNNIDVYMKEVKEYLENNLHLILSDPKSKNPKWTSISFDIEKVKINISTNNSTRAKTLDIQLQPIEGKKVYKDIIKKICTVSMFEFRDHGRYARMSNYKRLNNNEDLLDAFIDFLKELKQAFESLILKEFDLSLKKDLENMKNIIIQTQSSR